MSALNSNTSLVLGVLREHGAKQRGEILQLCPELNDLPTVSSALANLKAASMVERANNQCWRVTPDGRIKKMPADAGAVLTREPPRPPADEPPPSPEVRRPFQQLADKMNSVCSSPALNEEMHRPFPQLPGKAAAATTKSAAMDESIRDMVLDAARNAQATLDKYLLSVGDAAVVGPLLAWRDAAQAILAAFEEQQRRMGS